MADLICISNEPYQVEDLGSVMLMHHSYKQAWSNKNQQTETMPERLSTIANQ